MHNSLNHSKTYIPIMIYMLNIILLISFNTMIYDSSIKIILNICLIIFMQTFILILFGLDIISGISLLTIWILLPPIMSTYFGNSNYGLLGLGIVPVNLYTETLYIYIFIFIFSFSAYIFNIHFFEKRILNIKLPKLSNVTIFINNLIALIFSLVSFPTMPLISNAQNNPSTRFQMLLPGHAWNQLVIVALLFNLPYFIKRKSVAFTYLFSISWFLLHGERSDVSGLLFGIFIIMLFSKNVSKFKKFACFILSIFFVILLINIGYMRNSGHFLSIKDSINTLANFPTVSDISYIFSTSINYIQNVGFTHGKIIFKIIISFIPFVDGSNSVGIFLGQYYSYPGGSSIITPLLMDGGIIEIILFTIIYSLLIRYIVHKKTTLFKYEFLVLICSIPKISWYGINYIFTSMLFFVPFMFMLNKYFNSKK